MFTNKYKEFSSFFIKHQQAALYFLLVLLVFLSLFPRSVELFNQNPVFGFDQGRDYLAVKSIVVDHKLTLIGAELGAGSAGISGIFQGPGFFYLLAIPFILFNGNPAGGTVLMFALSVLAIIAGFLLGRKIFGKFWGFQIALLIAISPILISQARFVWNPHSPTLFILLTFYFLYLVIEKKQKLFIFLTAFFAGFIYNLEFGVSIPLCFSLFLFSIYLFKFQFKKYLFLFLGFLVAFSPMIAFEARHRFLALTGLISYLSNPNKIPGPSDISFIPDHAKSFIFGLQDTFPGVNNFNLALVFWILLISLSVYFLSKEKNEVLKKFLTFLLILIPGTFFIFYFLKNSVWTYYLTDLVLSYTILFTYLVFSSYRRKLYKLNFILIITASILILIAFNSSVRTTIYDYSDYGGTAKLKGKIDAIDYIYKDAKRTSFGVMVFTPPIYTYPYDYLFWWYGREKYNYVPYNDKRGLVYLLIENDPYKPWSSKGWLETVIKNGTIIKTVTLPSGFIIQKRIFNQ